MKEADFQRQVLEAATRLGWRTAHFRPAQNARGQWRTPVAGDGKGFPDLVLVRDRIIFAELKTDSGRVRPDQRDWLDALSMATIDTAGCMECGGAPVDVVVWRPRDWDDIIAKLREAA